MTKKIVLVGCGNVGSRHLQALSKLIFETEIHVVEPNAEAIKLGKMRLKEIKNRNPKITVFWNQTLKDLKKNLDLAIVATTSEGRVGIIKDLLNFGCKRFLIEKIVCQSSQEFEELLKELKKNNAKGWVNTNHRYFDSWKKINEYFKDSNQIHLSVISSNVSSLGTSGIHFIDLFAFFVNNYHIRLNGDLLMNKLYSNKRGKNFKEFAGTVFGSEKNNSTLSLTFLPNSDIPTIVNIAQASKHLLIDLTNEKILDLTGKNEPDFKFKYELASDITTKIVNDIIQLDKCDLSMVEDSYFLHKELFRIFNSHIQKITHQDVIKCPIT